MIGTWLVPTNPRKTLYVLATFRAVYQDSELPFSNSFQSLFCPDYPDRAYHEHQFYSRHPPPFSNPVFYELSMYSWAVLTTILHFGSLTTSPIIAASATPACCWNIVDCPYINFESFQVEAPYAIVNNVREEDIPS